MALNIKNERVERLASQVVALTGETKTEAVRRALEERLDRLQVRDIHGDRESRLMRVLEHEIWPQIPERVRGTSTTKREKESILGIGPEGV